MKNLIRVEDTKLYLAKNYIDGNKSLGQCLDEMPTVNAIEILDWWSVVNDGRVIVHIDDSEVMRWIAQDAEEEQKS